MSDRRKLFGLLMFNLYILSLKSIHTLYLFYSCDFLEVISVQKYNKV